MADYKLVPSKSFLKDLAKLPDSIRSKAAKELHGLKKDPYSGRNVKKLTNFDIGMYRLRIGDFRLRYDVEGSDIYLRIIKHRKDVYRKKL
ncbi:type II toxin-antitoxin system mRNA interferase toxin, RelE/StbE family [bacterium (Candidatus Howlettbacteria) CG_4_10_14_0_8_um_filter_40_9]|nr:MAG: type II toxin-antitoxin system mRNA interferase toxin, RelE/StbE family [bacterium (Candidatus Howlettbacteria) CG_4_10_14_0_8_um_filter_40_9]